MDSKNLRAIIFDWGGVCSSAAEPFASNYLQQRIGKSPDEIATDISELYFGYYKGLYSKKEFWTKVIAHYRLENNQNIKPGLLSAAYLHSYEIRQEMLSLVKKLKTKFKVALLSNLTPEMRDHIIKKHKILNYFQPAVFSCDPEIREVKPHHKPYKLLLTKLGLPAEKCLFIDDSPENLIAASTLGIKTLLFKDRAQIIKAIEPLL